jgi:hypothetical protein
MPSAWEASFRAGAVQFLSQGSAVIVFNTPHLPAFPAIWRVQGYGMLGTKFVLWHFSNNALQAF